MSLAEDDSLVTDLLDVLQRFPGLDKRSITKKMAALGWQNLDVHSVNSVLHAMRAGGRVQSDMSQPPSWWVTLQPPGEGDLVDELLSPQVEEILPKAFPGATWRELFPLLRNPSPSLQAQLASPLLPDRWWEQSEGLEDQLALWTAFTQIASALIQSRAASPLGIELPHLPSNTSLDALQPLPTRATNVLLRSGLTTLGELRSCTIGAMWDWRQVGPGTITDIVAAMVRLNAQRPDEAEAPINHPLGLLELGNQGDELDPMHAALLDDLSTVCQWRLLRLAGNEPLFPQQIDDKAPAEVQQAQLRLSALRAEDLVHSAVSTANPVADMEALCAALGERELAIARRRLFACEPATLEELGQLLGITRERVRQLETRIWEGLLPAIQYGTSTGDLAAVIRAHLNPMSRLAPLLEHYPALGEEVPALGQPLWLVLDRIDDDFEVYEGWAAAPTVQSAVDDTWSILEERMDRFGIVPVNAAEEVFSSCDQETLLDWLEFCEVPVLENHLLLRSGSIPDRAAALLAIAGEPLDVQSITNRALSDRSPNSVRNALGADARFVRVDKERWGLREWGHESYTGIRDLIGRQVDGAGGEIGLEDLITSLVDKFNVSPNSVSAYASSHPFELRSGQVRRCEQISKPRKTPLQTARLYQHGSVWKYRLRLTGEHARGSGFSVPVALAVVAGCEKAQVVELTTRLGPQQVRWTGQQPAAASIRRFMEHDGLTPGDHVFLIIDNGRFDVDLMIDDTALTPLDRALVRTGQNPGASAPLARLARVVGLDPSSSRSSLVEAYRARGDAEIESLLLAAWDFLDATPQQAAPPANRQSSHDDILELLGL